MAQRTPEHDPTYYPVDDGMGENTLELGIRIVLIPLLRRYLELLGKSQFVGGNQFIYWQQHAPTFCVAPDVYIVPGLPHDAEPESLKLWELGHACVPSFALEIVSQNWRKDYEAGPQRYEQLGTRELVLYDPDWETRSSGHKFQLFRRTRGGSMRLVTVTDEDRIKSQVLGCFLREVPEGTSARLRLGTGKHGEVLFPTEAEAERAEKDAALERVRDLEARVRELEKRRGR